MHMFFLELSHIKPYDDGITGPSTNKIKDLTH